MSAYGHQMEREFSAQSFLSREDTGTEMGSRYVLESGIYMTWFAATIFIAGLLTVGVLLITLLVTLSVMLQSCESRNKGLVELEKASDDSYHYCKAFALHRELNSLEQLETPPACRSLAVRYIQGEEYERDLNITIKMIESFFDTIPPSGNPLDVVLVDIDDILASNHPTYSYRLMHHQQFDRYGPFKPSGSIDDATNQRQRLTLELYMKLQSRGWSLILFSRKPERQRNVTIEHLKTMGFSSWSSLILRSDIEMETWEYFCRRRTAMKEEGIQIMSVISSQMDALTGSALGKCISLSFQNLCTTCNSENILIVLCFLFLEFLREFFEN